MNTAIEDNDDLDRLRNDIEKYFGEVLPPSADNIATSQND